MQDMLKKVQHQMRTYTKAYNQGLTTKRKRIEHDKSRRDHLQQEISTADEELKRLEKKIKTDKTALRALDRRIRDSDRDQNQLIQSFGQYAKQFNKTIKEIEPRSSNSAC